MRGALWVISARSHCRSWMTWLPHPSKLLLLLLLLEQLFVVLAGAHTHIHTQTPAGHMVVGGVTQARERSTATGRFNQLPDRLNFAQLSLLFF